MNRVHVWICENKHNLAIWSHYACFLRRTAYACFSPYYHLISAPHYNLQNCIKVEHRIFATDVRLLSRWFSPKRVCDPHSCPFGGGDVAKYILAVARANCSGVPP